MHRSWVIAATLLCGTSLSASADGRLPVVATIFPLADVARQLGDGHVEVVTLLPSGASPHTFEPTPAEVRVVARARLVVAVGGGLDTWAEKLLGARPGATEVVRITNGLRLRRGGDPHVWLDPLLVRDHIVPAILAALIRARAEQRAAFEHAAAEFRVALTRLDADIRNTLAPLANKNYISFHPGWHYFAQRYGLHEVAVVEPFPGKEPSAQEIAAVVRAARAAHVHAILIEPQLNRRIAQQIANEFGAQTVVVDPIGGPAVRGRDHYGNLMRYNLRAFAAALG
ncbi:MAG: metal ABC transporter substrate-binding protein [Candidatus Binatia bacterium]